MTDLQGRNQLEKVNDFEGKLFDSK